MLDQNTDRMWYVIGAVLIGAAIIFAANALFDDFIFAKITEFMNDLTGVAGENVGSIEKLDGGSGTPAGLINLVKTVPFF